MPRHVCPGTSGTLWVPGVAWDGKGSLDPTALVGLPSAETPLCLGLGAHSLRAMPQTGLTPPLVLDFH